MNRAGESPDAHRRTWELIPWLVNGRLAADERSAVEAHLQDCDACRRELEMQQRLREVMRRPGTIEYAPGPSLQKLRWRMDEIAAAVPQTTAEPLAAVGFRRPLPRRRVLPLWAGVLLAAQAAVIAVLAIAVLVQTMERGLPLYRTVTTAPAMPTDLRIVFTPRTTVAEIQAMLVATRTVIVAGPSPAGVYSLALTEGHPAGAVPRALEILRAHPEVLFVTAVQP